LCRLGQRRRCGCLPDAASSLCNTCGAVLQETLGSCGTGREGPRERCLAFVTPPESERRLHGWTILPLSLFPNPVPQPWTMPKWVAAPAFFPSTFMFFLIHLLYSIRFWVFGCAPLPDDFFRIFVHCSFYQEWFKLVPMFLHVDSLK